MPDLKIETSLQGIICGIDEAGRGPWAGPVVAGAVILPEVYPQGINDSKKLSESKREKIYEEIIQICKYGVGVASAEEIDSLNILGATKLAMLRAYENLQTQCDYALIDGNQLPKLPCAMQYVIKGDSISLSIAAASIVAKVTRDRIMHNLAKEHPYYGWDGNKGYGTKLHVEGIEKHGVSIHHRKSFAPIKAKLAALS